MTRLSFLVNRGENDCYMVHGLDWATYAEGEDWAVVTQTIMTALRHDFPTDDRPAILDFQFPDGKIVSMSA